MIVIFVYIYQICTMISPLFRISLLYFSSFFPLYSDIYSLFSSGICGFILIASEKIPIYKEADL